MLSLERHVPDSLRFSRRSLKPEVSSLYTLPLEETDMLLIVVLTVEFAMGH